MSDRVVLPLVTLACLAGAAALVVGFHRQDQVAHADQHATCTVFAARIDGNDRDRRHADAWAPRYPATTSPAAPTW